MKFGEKLREARIARGLSQKELAKRTGIAVRTIINYESNARMPKKQDSYARLAEVLDVDVDSLKDDNAGATILKNALKAPFTQIMENAGLNSQALLAQVEGAKDGQGINVMTPEKGLIDMKKAGVIDPARVTREAVQNAVSIAATTITMGALIVELPEKEDSAAAGAGMGGMY